MHSDSGADFAMQLLFVASIYWQNSKATKCLDFILTIFIYQSFQSKNFHYSGSLHAQTICIIIQSQHCDNFKPLHLRYSQCITPLRLELSGEIKNTSRYREFEITGKLYCKTAKKYKLKENQSTQAAVFYRIENTNRR